MSRPPGRVILKMSVQIPDGRKGTIHVFPGDNPRDLAESFCTRYDLTDPKLQRLVERHIADSMRNLPQVAPRTSLLQHRSHATSRQATPRKGSSKGPDSLDAIARGSSDKAQLSVLQHGAAAEEEATPLPPGSRELARWTAIQWQRRALQRSLLCKCFQALHHHAASERAWRQHEECVAAMELERQELHEANSRIATLAFSQAGVPMEVRMLPACVTSSASPNCWSPNCCRVQLPPHAPLLGPPNRSIGGAPTAYGRAHAQHYSATGPREAKAATAGDRQA